MKVLDYRDDGQDYVMLVCPYCPRRLELRVLGEQHFAVHELPTCPQFYASPDTALAQVIVDEARERMRSK